MWRSHGPKPHAIRTIKHTNDPVFEEKSRDVARLYVDPPHNAAMFSFDERRQIEALNRAQPVLPMRKWHCENMTHDYNRQGTTKLFSSLDIAMGEAIGIPALPPRTEVTSNAFRSRFFGGVSPGSSQEQSPHQRLTKGSRFPASVRMGLRLSRPIPRPGHTISGRRHSSSTEDLHPAFRDRTLGMPSPSIQFSLGVWGLLR